MTITANETSLTAFQSECEVFAAKMDKSKKTLLNAIVAAKSGWDDAGYEQIKAMVANVDKEIEDIKNTVASKVIPFVNDQLVWLRSKPY